MAGVSDKPKISGQLRYRVVGVATIGVILRSLVFLIPSCNHGLARAIVGVLVMITLLIVIALVQIAETV